MANDFSAITVAAEVRKTAHGVDGRIKSVDDTQEGAREGEMNVEDVGARVTDGTQVTPDQEKTSRPMANVFGDLTRS